MNILVILFVLGIAYTWSVRGMLNSMIHALCVFFAGAIAFAVWEPLAMILLGVSSSPVVEGMAWGVSLIVPFVVMMLVLRIATDKIVKSNMKMVKALDYGGGAAFGLVTSVLTAGVMIIGLGYMRLPSSFLGYQPIWYAEDRSGAGSLVENDTLWIPVDKITAMVYQNLSEGSMSSKNSLKKWYPDLTLTGFAARINPGEGSARNAIHEDAFSVLSSYIVGDTNGSTDKDQTIGEQKYLGIDGDSVGAGYLAGYVVEFGPKAKEKGDKGGQVMISNGQIRLLTQHTDGSTNTIFPLATISESSTAGRYGRWVFDSDDVFITSTGGKSRVPMGFEFFVPADETPLALYVKNIRVPVASMSDPQEFADASARSKLVESGALLTGSRVKRTFDLSNAVIADTSESENSIGARFRDSLGTVMPSQLVKQRGMKLTDDNRITGGRATFRSDEIGRKNTSSDKKLRVGNFWFGKGQEMVMVDVGSDAAGGFLSEAAKVAPSNEPFMLIDTDGNEYEAVGFVYTDSGTDLFKLRYTPGSTLSGLNEKGLPKISRSKEGQELSLVFLVSSKVDIQYFTIGDVVLVHYTPPLSRH